MDTVGQHTALLTIDIQKGFDDPVWGQRNNPSAEANMQALLDIWRSTQRPVYHVQHMSKRPNSPLRTGCLGNELKEFVNPLPSETLIHKSVNSAFIGTELEALLKRNSISELVVVGLTTDHCESTTVRIARNLGFQVYVVDDATATYERVGPFGELYSAQEIHNISLASLHGEFANLLEGVEVPPGAAHRIFNESGEDSEFLVVSHPMSHENRVLIGPQVEQCA